MLTNIRLRNFKAFRDTGDIRIAPLTVLTGPNSSGKSTIIRAMMALRQTVESRDQNTAFVPTGNYVDLGTYEDLAFRHDVKSSIGIDVAARIFPSGAPLRGLNLPAELDQSELSISLEFAELASIDRIYLKQATMDLDGGWVKVGKESMLGRQLGRSYRTSVMLSRDRLVKLASSSIAKFHVTPPLSEFCSCLKGCW